MVIFFFFRKDIPCQLLEPNFNVSTAFLVQMVIECLCFVVLTQVLTELFKGGGLADQNHMSLCMSLPDTTLPNSLSLARYFELRE